VRVAQGGGLGSYTALGISIGAAMACRVTMAVLGLIAIVADDARPGVLLIATNDERRTTNGEHAVRITVLGPRFSILRWSIRL